MTCPAELTFRRDRRLTPSAIRLYNYLSTALDHCEVREWKVYAMAEAVGISEKSAVAAVRQLLALGYLIGHGRAVRNVHSLTLAWSVADAPVNPPEKLTAIQSAKRTG